MRQLHVAGSGAAAGRWAPETEPMTEARRPLPTHIRDLPPFPTTARRDLDDGLRAVGLSPSPAERRALIDHLRFLLAWSTAVNLTAIRDPRAAVRLHLLDSLVAVPVVAASGARRFLDLGSGGGYPGLPVAIATGAEALLVDSVAKKARFLDVVIDALDLDDRVVAVAARAERLAERPTDRERWPLVLARAVAGLGELVELAFPLLEVGGSLIAWKRGELEAELAAGERAADALGGGAVEVRDVGLAGLATHVLVVVRKTGPTPAGFPRPAAARRRRPAGGSALVPSG